MLLKQFVVVLPCCCCGYTVSKQQTITLWAKAVNHPQEKGRSYVSALRHKLGLVREKSETMLTNLSGDHVDRTLLLTSQEEMTAI